MFGRERKSPELESNPELVNERLFQHAEKYAHLLLDVTGRDQAIATSVISNENAQKFGVQISIFSRTEKGFRIDYYVHSQKPYEIATFENVSEDAFGPQVYESTITHRWLPYDQTQLCQPTSFITSLEKMFGSLPDNAVVDENLK